MTTLTTQAASGRGGRTRFLLSSLTVLAAALLLPVSGCGDLLKINDPDIVTPGNLDDPSVLPTIRAGAIGDFDLSYSGSGAQGSGGVEGIIMTSGMLGDEWVNSETFPDRIATDARRNTPENASMQTVFRNLQRGRRAVEGAASSYARLLTDPTSNSGFGEMQALAGFSYLFLAENYCSGVPVSQANPDGTFSYGTPLTTTQLLDTAIVRFDAAIASTTDTVTVTRLARIGKARAQNDLGQFAAAATTVATIPLSFTYTVAHDENTARQNNGVFQANVTNERYSVADREGINGFPYRFVADPRTPFIRTPGTDVGFDGSTPQFDNLRYGDRSATVTVATGAEAFLLRAEAALQAGDTLTGGQFLAMLNGIRTAPPTYFNSNRPGVPPIPAMTALTAADIAAGGAVNLLFAERARWLWLTAHRLSDMRRLIRQYRRATESVFPTGAYFKPPYPTYGTDVNFPVPIDEENNPNFTQCIDRNP